MKRRGTTIIEVIVVIAIIGILLALLVGAVARAREYANYCASINNLRQIGLATLNWSSSRNDRLPALSNSDGDASEYRVFVDYIAERNRRLPADLIKCEPHDEDRFVLKA